MRLIGPDDGERQEATDGEGLELTEAVARAIYDAMRENDPEGRRHPWMPGGNSWKQEEARSRARAALAEADCG
jgi:hypothetical protein